MTDKQREKDTVAIAKAVIKLQDALNPSMRDDAPAYRPPIAKWKYPEYVFIHDGDEVRPYMGSYYGHVRYLGDPNVDPDDTLPWVSETIEKMCPETKVVSDGAKPFLPCAIHIDAEGNNVINDEYNQLFRPKWWKNI